MVSIQQKPVLSENLQRFATFANFPLWCPVYSSKLSSAGFSYGGKLDVVRCMSCGLEIGDWINQKLSPILVHLQNAPLCPLAKELQKIVAEVCPDTEKMQESYTSKHEYFEVVEKTDQSALKQSPGAIIIETTKLQERPPVEKSDESMDYLDGRNSLEICSASHVLSQSFIPNIPPKYENYMLLFQRVETFDRWPLDHPISPENLATAGFFYTGINDLVRCFNCGGGLTSWDTEDNPWVEHAHWFPKCTFLRQNKGDEFIQIVQKTVKELTEQEKTHNSEELSPSETSTFCTKNSNEDNIEQLVCVKSVQELGYSIDIIKVAYIDAARKLETDNISAVQLLEQIFENEENIPPGASGFSIPLPNDSENLPVTTRESRIESNTLSHKEPKKPLRDQQHKQSRTATEGAKGNITITKDTLMCKVCFEEPESIAFIPCGHISTCGQCAPAMRKCPICREIIKGTLKTYLS